MKIDDSRPAPRFNVIVQPNDWTKPPPSMTDTQRLQLEFWTGFRELMESSSEIPVTNPSPTSYITHRAGITGLRVVSFFTTWNSARGNFSIGELRVALEFFSRDRLKRFTELSDSKELIGREAGQPYFWQPWESATIHRVMVRKDADIEDRQKWPDYQKWLKTEVKRIFRVLVPKAKDVAG